MQVFAEAWMRVWAILWMQEVQGGVWGGVEDSGWSRRESADAAGWGWDGAGSAELAGDPELSG